MLTAQQAWRILEESDLIYSAEDIEQAIDRVAAEISAQFKDSYPLILCVMNGAIFFCSRLMSRLRFPLDLDYVHASRYGANLDGRQVSWKVEPGPDIKGRTVLIVEDILDEGRTLAEIRNRVMAVGAASCHSAVLTDKLLDKPKPVKADFVCLQVPNRFVFGCGLDAYGCWRNLPEIYALKENFVLEKRLG